MFVIVQAGGGGDAGKGTGTVTGGIDQANLSFNKISICLDMKIRFEIR